MSELLAEPAAEPVEPVAPAEPVEPTAVEPTPAPAPAPQSWDDPALLDLVDTRAQQLVQQQLEPLIPFLQQIAGGSEPQPQGGQLVDEFGQVDPNALVQLIAQSQQQTLGQMQQMLQGIAAPLAARQAQETVAEGEQRLQDILADDISRNGEFSADADADKAARSLVRTLADQAFPEIAQRYGQTPRAAEMAMARASAQVREVLAADRKASQSIEQNRIAAMQGARVEPGAAAVGVEGLSDKPLSSRELAAKYSAKAVALTGT